MIIKLIKYLGNDDNMSMMGEQFDMTIMKLKMDTGLNPATFIVECYVNGLRF